MGITLYKQVKFFTPREIQDNISWSELNPKVRLHFGEKMKYGKTDLWEESCRVCFIVKAPAVTPKKGGVSNEVVNLMDMYPTLIELCGLPLNKENDGRSFAKFLASPKMKCDEPPLSTYQYKNHSLTDGRFCYTWYGSKNGAEELYDHNRDPLEYKILYINLLHKKKIDRLKKNLPTHHELPCPVAGSDGEGDAEANPAKKEKGKSKKAKNE